MANGMKQAAAAVPAAIPQLTVLCFHKGQVETGASLKNSRRTTIAGRNPVAVKIPKVINSGVPKMFAATKAVTEAGRIAFFI